METIAGLETDRRIRACKVSPSHSFLSNSTKRLRESWMREICTSSLSGGRRSARSPFSRRASRAGEIEGTCTIVQSTSPTIEMAELAQGIARGDQLATFAAHCEMNRLVPRQRFCG